MTLTAPEKYWWKTPLHKEEKAYLAIAVVFAVVIFTGMMPLWHLIGQQNPSSTAYRTTAEKFLAKQNEFIAKYQVGTEKGVPVVRPAPGADIYLSGQTFFWRPILVLEKGKTYTLHITSYDVNHGFSVYPMSMNIQVPPGYVWVLKMTPTEAGEYHILCNEFCGLGHHTMTRPLYVVE